MKTSHSILVGVILLSLSGCGSTLIQAAECEMDGGVNVRDERGIIVCTYPDSNDSETNTLLDSTFTGEYPQSRTDGAASA